MGDSTVFSRFADRDFAPPISPSFPISPWGSFPCTSGDGFVCGRGVSCVVQARGGCAFVVGDLRLHSGGAQCGSSTGGCSRANRHLRKVCSVGIPVREWCETPPLGGGVQLRHAGTACKSALVSLACRGGWQLVEGAAIAMGWRLVYVLSVWWALAGIASHAKMKARMQRRSVGLIMLSRVRLSARIGLGDLRFRTASTPCSLVMSTVLCVSWPMIVEKSTWVGFVGFAMWVCAGGGSCAVVGWLAVGVFTRARPVWRRVPFCGASLGSFACCRVWRGVVLSRAVCDVP